jgi:uncharacterized protein YggE
MKHFMTMAALGGALAAGPAALADTAGGDARFEATTLDLTGHGEARAAPDMATISLGVTSDAPDAAAAMSQNAEAMTKVVATLKSAGVEARDIATSSLTLNPQYAYNQGQAPRLTGYQAVNRVTVRVEELSRLGAVVDAVVKAGATDVGQISFGLKAPGSAQNLARLTAVKDLDDKAALLANSAGYHIRRLVNLTEVTGAVAPPPRPLMAMAAGRSEATTPVEAGELTVSVDVRGEFELTH